MDSAGDRAVECVVVYSEDSPTALIVVGLGLLGGPFELYGLGGFASVGLNGPQTSGNHEASSVGICCRSVGCWWHVTYGQMGLGDYYLDMVKILFS